MTLYLTISYHDCQNVLGVNVQVISFNQAHMCLDARKPVFWVPDKVRFKPTCSAKETSLKILISLVASVDMILSNKQITKVLIPL